MSRVEVGPDQVDAIESFVTDWMSDDRIPGAALAVVDAEGRRYAEGFGARNLSSNAPATPDTLYGVGSCTKSFTAAAVLQLRERSDLSVDDPVDDYLPHLTEIPGDPVTIHELLTHTSGMPSDGSAEPLIARHVEIGGAGPPLSGDADFRRHVEGSLDRRVTDRETCFYYNSGYTVLSNVVEEVTGRPYADYVEENLLAPLGMERSTFSRETFRDTDDRMTPYVGDDDGHRETSFPFDSLIHGPGGLVSSVAEMGEWTRTLLRDGSLDGRILAADSVADMATPEGTFATYFDGSEVGYGYGLMVEDFLGDRLVGHGGSIGVSNAWFGYLEDSGVGVAVACSTGPDTHPMVVGPAVLAILDGEDPEEVVPHFRLRSSLSGVTGEYAGYRGVRTATVERVGGSLRMAEEGPGGAQESLLTPESVDGDHLVCTTVDGSGRRYEVRFETGGDRVTAFFGRERYERVE